MFELFTKYKEIAFILLGIAAISLAFSSFVSSFRKRHDQHWQKDYWKGYLLLSISLIFIHLHYVINLPSPFNYIKVVVSIILLIYGFYLIKQGSKLNPNIQTLPDISKPVGLVFGIISLFCVPFMLFISLLLFVGSLFVDERLSLQMQWAFMIAGVLSIVVTALLAVAGWRLIQAQKGSKVRLFSPYWLWLRLTGILFVIVALSRLWQRNMQGVWIALVAVALLFLSKWRMTDKKQIE